MQRKAARLASIAGLVVTAIGAAVFCGWVFDVHALKAVYGQITMKTNAALALTCCGVALWVGTRGRAPRSARTASAIAAGIGTATLLQHLFGWNFGIDELLFTEVPGAAATASPNRMGPHASTSFIAAGIALLALQRKTSSSLRAAQALAFTGAAFAMVAAVGYVYGAVELYGIAAYTGIALPTAVAFLILHVGILAASARVGAMATFIDEGVAGTLLRRLAVPVVALPLMLGYLFVWGRSAELFDRGLGMSLFAVATIIVLLAMLWRTAAAIQASDQDRRTAYEAAEAANQLKDQFIAILSHELRTPLNVILGRLRLLEGLEAQPNPESRLRAAAVIARNGQLLARLVEDLLDLSRISSGQFEIARQPVDLNALVQAAVESVAADALKRQIRVSIEVDPKVGFLNADATRMQQVLVNLLSNALKFTPAGGSVTVRTARDAAKVTITVNDTGIGFDEAFVPHLFEPFRQADQSARREHGGLGLGLSIARHLVLLHGGTISGSSPGPGRGATFIIELPVGPAEPPPSAELVAARRDLAISS